MPFILAENSKQRKQLEAKARRVAAAAGYSIFKSKVRPGGYRLIDQSRNLVTLRVKDLLSPLKTCSGSLAKAKNSF